MDILSAILHPKRYLAAKAKHQRDILQIMAVLPGKHRYKAVDAAVYASGLYPEGVYTSLAVGEDTMALARFYEALTGEER